MSVTLICHGCGEAFALPEGHTRNKIQCPGCGVICPVPAGATAKSTARPAKGRKAPAAAPASAPSFDPLAAEPPPPAPKPKEPPNFNPFDGEEEPLPDRPKPSAERLFGCRRCGRKVRRQGACPNCDGAPALASGMPALELGPDKPPTSVREEDEEGTPYEMADKDLPRCPKCRKEMPEGGVLCVACGFNLRTRKKAVKEYEPLARSWETDMSLPARLAWWGGGSGSVLVLGMTLVGMADANLVGFFLSWLFFAAMLAFLAGTFARIDMTRDRKGRVVLTKVWRFAFVPAEPYVTEVRGFEGIVSGQWDDAGFWEWLIFVFLVPWGIIPGALWWYFVIHHCAYHVALSRDHGAPAVYVYRGRRQEQMRDIATFLCDATGLRDVA